jgi:hypothetical protein
MMGLLANPPIFLAIRYTAPRTTIYADTQAASIGTV